jgi:outer membrane protein assembly factor BamB
MAGIVGLGTASLAAKTTAQQSNPQEGWNHYQYDKRNSGYNPDASGPKADVGIEWSKDFAGFSLVSDQDSIYVDTGRSIFKYSIGNGEREWEFSPDPLTQFEPLTYAEGSIYALGRNSVLYSISAATGEKNWEFQVPYPLNSEFAFHSAPQYSNGVIYLRAKGINSDVEERFCRVFAIDTEQRAIIWETDDIPVAGGSSGTYTAPAIGDGSIYVGSVSVNKTNGEIEWIGRNKQEDSPIRYQEYYSNGFASLYDDQVFVGYGGGVTAFDTNSGEINWSTVSEFNNPPTLITTPAVDGDYIYHSRVEDQDGNRQGAIVALNIENGNQVWEFDQTGHPLGAPIIGNNTLYVSFSNNNLYAINSDTGEELWRFNQTNVNDRFPENNIPVDKVVSRDSLFIGDRDSIYRLSAAAANQDGPGGAATIFRQFTEESVLPAGVIGAGILGGVGIGMYRRLKSGADGSANWKSDTDSEHTPGADSSASKSGEENAYADSTFNDYEQDQELRRSEYMTVTAGSIDNNATVALYSCARDGETIDKTLLDKLADGFEAWSKVDDHENILTVYQHGDTPTPWAAVELADEVFNPGDFVKESVATKRDLIVDLCEAVHEGHRLGLAHGNLPDATFIVEAPETPIIKIGDWGITEAAINDEADQQADIEAVVDIAFELFIGESPSTVDPSSISYPDGLESVFETAWEDESGYETVIHFRDAITEST